MLTRLALMFVLHVLVLGVVFGRRMEFLHLSKLGWIFSYLILFYMGWGLVFSLFPQAIMPELVP
ncbi:MAG TPA: hypothetical protein VE954_08425 [Oligoflexus sp.]|uniref:hypothetical protein n=1 Tax=Oligoflexus sp. TaxID=1971216 RepID=UPI002D65DE88|nr:hypothetical protein [Oligoflexus sp.]HYX33129.1 hypothetical protein [Oligoflexus sp.]